MLNLILNLKIYIKRLFNPALEDSSVEDSLGMTPGWDTKCPKSGGFGSPDSPSLQLGN